MSSGLCWRALTWQPVRSLCRGLTRVVARAYLAAIGKVHYSLWFDVDCCNMNKQVAAERCILDDFNGVSMSKDRIRVDGDTFWIALSRSEWRSE